MKVFNNGFKSICSFIKIVYTKIVGKKTYRLDRDALVVAMDKMHSNYDEWMEQVLAAVNVDESVVDDVGALETVDKLMDTDMVIHTQEDSEVE